MSNSGFVIVDYKSWALVPESVSEELINVIKRYLWGSLAIGASKVMDDCIDVLGLDYSSEAEEFLQELQGDKLQGDHFKIEFKDSSSGVSSFIAQRDGHLWDCEEYFVCVRSTPACVTTRVRELKEHRDTESKGRKDAASEVARRYYEVDSVYRHLRNALAHACFRVVEIKGRQGLFLFDVNREGKPSCVALLSFERLGNWYQTACSWAKRDIVGSASQVKSSQLSN